MHISAIRCLSESNSKIMNIFMSDYKHMKLEEAIEKFSFASD